MEQGKQESTKELQEQAKNPYWHNREFMGPNTFRKEKDMDKYGEEES